MMILEPIGGLIQLNVGCGQCPDARFCNIDTADSSRQLCESLGYRFVRAEAHSLPFGDRSADLVYASHLLEHFPAEAVDGLPSGLQVLAEWVRVLKPGGRCCVAVPDMRTIARELFRSCHLDDGWLQDIYGFPLPGMRHFYGYTEASLTAAMARVGLRDVRPFDWHLNYPLTGIHDAAGSRRRNDFGEDVCTSLNLQGTKA